MNWPATASILLALAVMLGAFGAHGLRGRVDAYSLSIWEKAVLYHFIHALGMLLVPLLAPSAPSRVCWLLFAGILIFSGSLYLLAVTGIRGFGAITPIGGLSFIAAWLLLAWRLTR